MKPKGFADLADLSEDTRIHVIVRFLDANPGKVAGVVVDDDPDKVERYTRKLRALGCAVQPARTGPVPNVVTLQVTKQGSVQ